MDKSVKDKVILITGGATGLGLAIADKFLDNGAKIIIIFDVNLELGKNAAIKLNEKYGSDKADFLKCDVLTDLEEIFETVKNKYKNIDVLINNAGIVNEKCVKSTIDINVTALMEWTIKFYDYMRSDRGGHGGTIINISSIYGVRIKPFLPYYHASKFAVVGFSKSLGHEYNYKRTKVRVIAICPGFTYTNLTSKISLRDDDISEDFNKEAKSSPWQEADAVGSGVVEAFEKADSGTVWLVEGSQPAVKI